MSAGLPSNLSDVQVNQPALVAPKNSLPKPCDRVLETDLNIQFSKIGKDPVTRLMWYLWDDQEIFKLFIDRFMVKQCEITPEEYERDP